MRADNRDDCRHAATVAGHRPVPRADGCRCSPGCQDTIWSRSAVAARLGPGDTCDNAFGGNSFGAGTDCSVAARAHPQAWPGRTRLTMEDWTAFGRVDADGTVYVKTADGERAVGSWQAGTPEEGLAHFARRFDDLVTEVNLIEARLGSGAADAQQCAGHRSSASMRACPRRTSSATSTACRRGWRSSPASRREKADEPRAARDAARDRGARRARPRWSTEAEALGRRVDELEGDRRPVQGDPRRVEDDPRRRPQDRRRAVEAVRRRARRVHPPPRRPLRDPRREPQAGAGSQGRAGRRGRGAVRLDRVERDGQPAQGADDRVEGRAARRQGRRAEAVGTVPRRPGRLLHAAQRDVLGAGRRGEGHARTSGRPSWPRPRRSTSTPTRRPPRPRCATCRRSGTTPDGCRATSGADLDRRWRAVEEKIRAAMDVAWRRPEPSASPLLLQMRDQVAEAEARLDRAKAAGDAKRIREAEAGPGRQAAVPRLGGGPDPLAAGRRAGHARSQSRPRAAPTVGMPNTTPAGTGGVPGLVGIAGPGAPVRPDRAVGVEVMRCRVRDVRVHDVAGSDGCSVDAFVRPRGTAVRGEVDEPAVAGPAGHAPGRAVLAALADGDQDLLRGADELACSRPR